jgi:ribose transport system substrate-binding protein
MNLHPMVHTAGVQAGARRRSHRRVVPALGLAAMLMLAACGNDDSGTQSGGSGSDSSSGSGVDAEVQAAYDQSRQPVEGLGDLTEPLASAPKPGQTMVYINCGSPICQTYDAAAKEAAQAVGWEYKSISFSLADPATMVAGLDTALQFHPGAVLVAGQDPALWEASRQEYEDAGIPIIGLTIPNLEASPTVVNVMGNSAVEAHGKTAADWFITDSKGQGKALIVGISSIPLFQIITDAFNAEIKATCPDCSSKSADITPAQIQQAPQLIVAALRQDPSITHVIGLTGTLVTGLHAQLEAAGLAEQVTIGGTLATEANLAELGSGDIAASTVQSTPVEMWAAFDAAFRMSEDMEVDPAVYESMPQATLIDSGNVDDTPDLLSPGDYRDQFKKLWLVG